MYAQATGMPKCGATHVLGVLVRLERLAFLLARTRAAAGAAAGGLALTARAARTARRRLVGSMMGGVQGAVFGRSNL